MLDQICAEIKNWFDRDQIKLFGAFEIGGGRITDADFVAIIKPNQYFRIIGSTFNDGVYRWDDQLNLDDEVFVGAVWLMAVPKEVIALSQEISDWQTKYGETINSPYSSESFGGYSYTKSSGVSGDGSNGAKGWQSVFANRLNRWRKL